MDERRVFINPRLWFVDHDGHRVIFYHHQPIYRVALSDRVHLRYVAVNLRLSELASQEEIAGAFGHSVGTQRRWERRFQEKGIEGLEDRRPSGRPPQLEKAQEAFVRRWFGAGVSNREMARRLGVSEKTIRRTLKRLGLERPAESVQLDLPGTEESEGCGVGEKEWSGVAVESEAESGEWEGKASSGGAGERQGGDRERERSEEVDGVVDGEGGLTIDRDPGDRSGDRALARQGLLADAVPLFGEAGDLPRAGVLLAVPLLVAGGLVEVFRRVYGSLGPAFYGLRTMVVVLFLCALLRIKRPEQLKEYAPGELGRVMGLDRVPEVKTIRRKLSRLAAMGGGKELMEELARRRIEAEGERIAFLYVDGHVREYFGKHPLSKTKKAQRAVARAAATDTWVHDAAGEPLLVVTSQMNAKLTQVLEPILEDVKRWVPQGRRVTVIFDRGGYSPKLFARLVELGFDVITYRKGKMRKLPRDRFQKCRQRIEGRWVEYEVYDRARVRVGRLWGRRKKGARYLWLREVRVLRKDGRQTPVLTSRSDLSAVEVAYRIFGRWRQENFFKYMGEEFALDGLVEYGVEAVSEELDRPNPQRAKVDKQLRVARAEVKRLEGELGARAEGNEEKRRWTMRGFKIAQVGLRRKLKWAKGRVARLEKKRRGVPKRIPATDVVAPKSEKKLIMDAIKMCAYQVETQLLGMLQRHYARSAEEGRRFLRAAFQSSARLEVCDGELRVTIAAQSSPHRTRALAGLCEELNRMKACFPGTRLRLCFCVEPPEPLTS